MTHAEIAREYFIKGYNCSQAVFAAYSDITGIDPKNALRISAPFGAGMGKMREVCGACSGMFMVAGVLFGYDEASDENKAQHYSLIQELAERFKNRHETIICRDLLKNLETDTSPVPQKRDEHYYKTRPCLRFVESACEILDEFIEEKNNENKI